MPGMDRNTGKPLDGWAHVAQSIEVILTTFIGERVMRRDFGSDVPDAVFKPTDPHNLILTFGAIAQALAKWEPRFVLQRLAASGGPDGHVNLRLDGVFEGDARTVEVRP